MLLCTYLREKDCTDINATSHITHGSESFTWNFDCSHSAAWFLRELSSFNHGQIEGLVCHVTIGNYVWHECYPALDRIYLARELTPEVDGAVDRFLLHQLPIWTLQG